MIEAEMLKNKIKAEIRRIVAWQFDGINQLTNKVYDDSLEMIAEQTYNLFSKWLKTWSDKEKEALLKEAEGK